MLAAVTGLAYTIGHLLRVESYLAYVLPLPLVLAALRSGPAAALKTLTTTFLLLLSEWGLAGRGVGVGARRSRNRCASACLPVLRCGAPPVPPPPAVPQAG